MQLFFFIITFIIIICVIFLAESFVVAMLIITLISNFLVISLNSTKIAQKLKTLQASNTTQPPTKSVTPDETNSTSKSDSEQTDELPDVLKSMYGENYEKYQKIKESYTNCYDDVNPVIGMSYGEGVNTVDALNTLMAQKRFRDKKSMDGYVLKTSDFYKYYFADELKEFEAKPWWGDLEDEIYQDKKVNLVEDTLS